MIKKLIKKFLDRLPEPDRYDDWAKKTMLPNIFHPPH